SLPAPPSCPGAREPAVLQLVRSALAEGPQRLPDLRASHGAPRRLTPVRLRRGALPATAVVLVLAAAGCGDNKPTAHSAPLKGAPALPPPPHSASNGDTANPPYHPT